MSNIINFAEERAKRENSEPWLSKRQAAQHLGDVTPRTITNWMRERGLPHKKLPGGTVLFRRSELDAWVEAQDVVAGGAAAVLRTEQV